METMETSNLSLDDYDELKLKESKSIRKALEENESILFSALVYKYNKKLKRQERSILITSKAIYNINQKGIITSLMTIFNKGYKIKRRIDMRKLSGISVSDVSSEFVLHVNDEYDYRYASPGKRDQILLMICKAYSENSKNSLLKFFFRDDVNLTKFATTKNDKKLKINRMVTEDNDGEDLDEGGLRERLEGINQIKERLREHTKTIYSRGQANPTNPTLKITLDDFEILKVLGRGAFGKVMLVEKKDTKEVYAMKSLRKEYLIVKEQIEHMKAERYVLEVNRCPFLVGLEFAFQTPDKIFFVMKFMRGGELFQHLRISKRFDEQRARFYAVEILLGIEYLHQIDIIYRDLKPENILMDEDGHVCITDFGMAKYLEDDEVANSFVGTPEYLAPEILERKGHGKPVDWWTFGVLMYEMLCGRSPFQNRERSNQKTFHAILNDNVTINKNLGLSAEAHDLIMHLLVKNPEKRLGFNGANEIKEHKWFAGVDWKAYADKKVVPPFQPKIKSKYDCVYFDEEYTSEAAENSVIRTHNKELMEQYQQDFKDFTYVPSNDLLKKAGK